MKCLIAIPAHNEAAMIEQSIQTLVAFCRLNLRLDWQVVIADNKSTDRTADLAQHLAWAHERVSYCYVDRQGKGAAIRAAWERHDDADVYCFMDADLATDLCALPQALAAITQGYDVAIGSRFHPDSQVRRSVARKFFSWGYRLVLAALLRSRLSDAPCGFKCITRSVKKALLPQVQSTGWFFDSELVILAERLGFKIKELPVTWHDPREGADKSRVAVWRLAASYFAEIWRLRQRLRRKKPYA